MTRCLVVLLILISLGCSTAVSLPGADYDARTLFIAFKDGVLESSRDQFIRLEGLSILERIPIEGRMAYVVKLPPNLPVEEAAKKFMTHPHVRGVSYNFFRE